MSGATSPGSTNQDKGPDQQGEAGALNHDPAAPAPVAPFQHRLQLAAKLLFPALLHGVRQLLAGPGCAQKAGNVIIVCSGWVLFTHWFHLTSRRATLRRRTSKGPAGEPAAIASSSLMRS